MIWKKDFCVVQYNFDPIPTNFTQRYFTPFDHRHCKWSMSQIGPWGENIYNGRGFYIHICHDINLRPINMIKGHYTPFTQRHSVGKVWAILGQGERRYAPDKRPRTDRRRKNGRTDRLITTGRPQSGAQINYANYDFFFKL